MRLLRRCAPRNDKEGNVPRNDKKEKTPHPNLLPLRGGVL